MAPTTIDATPESTAEKVNMQVKTETELASVENTAPTPSADADGAGNANAKMTTEIKTPNAKEKKASFYG
ncbi:MAG: hypothetical protein ALECFALPRED_010946 [Alectoria fallacina]|uniref:Uncharacterized protein n=1 Tax=Alectoria fallacina TaxID=1903189 RepID=A0A8H3IKH5_9LECA|nr:MAG: hypothetical protein ALECFALPRED_010946 [Alectoria fallacina]